MYVPLLYFIVGLNALLCIIILIRGNKRIALTLFTLIATSVAAWGFVSIGYYSDVIIPMLSWLGAAHIMALSVVTLFFYFSTVFPRRILKGKFILTFTTIPFIIIVFFLSFSDFILGPENEVIIRSDYGSYVYLCTILFYLIFGYFFLAKQYQLSTDSHTRSQVRLIMLGSVLSTAPALMSELVFPSLGIYTYTWLGPLFSSVLVISIFIAIIRYHLFDLKVVITEIISFGVWMYFLIKFLLSDTWQVQVTNLVYLLSLLFIGILLVQSVLKEVIERRRVDQLTIDMKATFDKLKTVNASLIEIDRQKTKFLSLATHQIRGPLTSIKGYTSMIFEGDYGELPDKLKEPLTKMYQLSQSLVSIVEDFLNTSKMDGFHISYQYSLFNIDELVNAIIDDMKQSLSKTKAKLLYDVTCGNTCMIHGDKEKIRQIFHNLIENAIKYTQDGEIKISTKRAGEKIIFKISDTGIGMSNETISHIFKKFSRAEKIGEETHISGSGLGLYVAKEMVKGHHGKIWAESPGEGKGSTFFVELDAVA
jgi:signal transduction histidine kinase